MALDWLTNAADATEAEHGYAVGGGGSAGGVGAMGAMGDVYRRSKITGLVGYSLVRLLVCSPRFLVRR